MFRSNAEALVFKDKPYRASVQGSTFHYCIPRQNLPYTEYTAMEIALMDGGKWLRPGRGDPADHYWNSDDVAGYVPVAEIDALLSRIDSGMCVPVPRGGLY